jgi:hypothetical protein
MFTSGGGSGVNKTWEPIFRHIAVSPQAKRTNRIIVLVFISLEFRILITAHIEHFKKSSAKSYSSLQAIANLSFSRFVPPRRSHEQNSIAILASPRCFPVPLVEFVIPKITSSPKHIPGSVEEARPGLGANPAYLNFASKPLPLRNSGKTPGSCYYVLQA